MENNETFLGIKVTTLWRLVLTSLMLGLGGMNSAILDKSSDIQTEIVNLKAEMTNYKKDLDRVNVRIDAMESRSSEERQDMRKQIEKLQDKLFSR